MVLTLLKCLTFCSWHYSHSSVFAIILPTQEVQQTACRHWFPSYESKTPQLLPNFKCPPPKKRKKKKNSKRAKSYSDTGPVDNSLHSSLGSSCQPQGSHFIHSALILSLHSDGTSAFTSKAQWGATSCQCGRRKKQWDAQMHSIEKPRDASQNIPSSRALLWKTHRRADYWWCTCCGKKTKWRTYMIHNTESHSNSPVRWESAGAQTPGVERNVFITGSTSC